MLMPGRVQGWPAGTQRASNAAQRLLSQAVAWWDVESYREGDRFLRNRGTGGELLDLRLGSSAVTATSNDPQYLPATDDGYVFLTGVAGNSLSVTAPATATQFIAYPLDRSASNTTGSVTGGATFTFSTTGSWRLIELRDASNVVVDTIDCDAITSGSNTSFLSVGNQTVTINRSTSHRKAVAVPSRHVGGRPVMLLGFDDYLAIPDENVWQHGLLNPALGSFTVLFVGRRWGTPNLNSCYIAKDLNGLLDKAQGRWKLRQAGTAATTAIDLFDTHSNYVTTTGTACATWNVGDLKVLGFVVNRSAQVVQTWDQNAFTATSPSIKALGNITSPFIGFGIGRSLGRYTDSADFDFYAAAVWLGKALTSSELKVAADYYTGRIA